ncbi:MAG: LacI family DNA-binding transcriptional regulator [Geodermatophilaceae bacterium]|nr:LacI family DNA-binding transcriptional regulator [Geodermatophilaceae bacterium]
MQAAIDVLGYERNEVASSLRTDRTSIIMLAIPDITNPFWPDVARGVQDHMDREGYAVVFANSDWEGQRERAFLRMARRSRFDAVLINPIEVTNEDLLATHIPTVLIGSREDYPDFDTVGSDSYGAITLALDHLFSLGHRRIGLIRGRRQNRRGQSRLTGYLDFLKAKGISPDERLIVETPFHQGGAQGMQHLLALEERPTAVAAANDELALGALQAAQTAGLQVPHDLSVVGLDDIYAASTSTPALTTVSKPKYEIGQKAAEFLLDRIHGRAPAQSRRHIYPCQLLVRHSTASPRM